MNVAIIIELWTNSSNWLYIWHKIIITSRLLTQNVDLIEYGCSKIELDIHWNVFTVTSMK